MRQTGPASRVVTLHDGKIEKDARVNGN